MATEANLTKKIEVKLAMLEILKRDIPDIIHRNKGKELEKTISLMENRLDELQDLKRDVQEIMIENGSDVTEINEWGDNMKEQFNSYEDIKVDLEAALEKLKIVDEEKATVSEKIKIKKRMEEEMKIEEAKIKMRMEYEKKAAEEKQKMDEKNVMVKLPKLQITKFQGTHLDWTRFWNQFEMEIDKSTLAPVSKFSHLKEYLQPKVRLLIDGLPFTAEGYNRAKSILKARYGKPSEVANAHIESIMTLPSITSSNTRKIHDFYEKLITNINALDTMGKLKDINGNVRLILDKLSGIRADLVRLDDNWQNWTFPEFVEALRKWTERHPISTEKSQLTLDTKNSIRKEKMLQTSQNQWKPRKCIYCEDTNHKAADCEKVKELSERKKIIATKRLCYNCVGNGHRAVDCKSKRRCLHCKGLHHSSICDKTDIQATPLKTVLEESCVVPLQCWLR